MATGATGNGVNQQQRDVSKPKPRVIAIEDAFEHEFFDDGKTRYVVKVCKINGIPKVGFTRFFFGSRIGKFIPGSACFMTVPAWHSFMKNNRLTQDLLQRGLKLQRQCDAAHATATGNGHSQTDDAVNWAASHYDDDGARVGDTTDDADDEPEREQQQQQQSTSATTSGSVSGVASGHGTVGASDAGTQTGGATLSLAKLIAGNRCLGFGIELPQSKQRQSAVIKETAAPAKGPSNGGGDDGGNADASKQQKVSGAAKRKRGRPVKLEQPTKHMHLATTTTADGGATSSQLIIAIDENANHGCADHASDNNKGGSADK